MPTQKKALVPSKITPAHDFNDFEVGKRHKLPCINFFDEQAHYNDNVATPWRGLDRFEARARVLDALRNRTFSTMRSLSSFRLPSGIARMPSSSPS